MATYKALRDQIEQLTQQAEAARASELQAVISEIQTKILDYCLTEKDIFPRKRGRPYKAEKATLAPKYRDPKTGKTCHCGKRGRPARSHCMPVSTCSSRT
ncbi:H-NS histone family protein [Paraburkholderia madseniana]|uniref:H-NS histone family protein n=1 Tax=Paraburkholderia madseniana TaxID=2599607 RepID=A0A6N6WG58_9BURK|nr:H-NS histone family protein [Paraburkholderia madseniana]KAE8758430.1 H-NS histone family protein [Paraburkholderia madseniana]